MRCTFLYLANGFHFFGHRNITLLLLLPDNVSLINLILSVKEVLLLGHDEEYIAVHAESAT